MFKVKQKLGKTSLSEQRRTGDTYVTEIAPTLYSPHYLQLSFRFGDLPGAGTLSSEFVGISLSFSPGYPPSHPSSSTFTSLQYSYDVTVSDPCLRFGVG